MTKLWRNTNKMSIKIKQNGERYRLVIDDEEWEFLDRKSMELGLKFLLDLKEKRGKIQKSNKDF